MNFFNPFYGGDGSGGTVDAYTKDETNTLLAGKADLQNGIIPIS